MEEWPAPTVMSLSLVDVHKSGPLATVEVLAPAVMWLSPADVHENDGVQVEPGFAAATLVFKHSNKTQDIA